MSANSTSLPQIALSPYSLCSSAMLTLSAAMPMKNSFLSLTENEFKDNNNAIIKKTFQFLLIWKDLNFQR